MDKDLLLSVLSREAIVEVCKKFKVRVDGFQKNLDRAQINKLGTSLRTAILSAELGKKRKGGTTPVSLVEIIDYLYENIITKRPNISEISLEDLIIEVEQNPEFTNYHGLVVFYKQFSEVYDEKKELLKNNLDNEHFIFQGLSKVNEIPLIDKINGVIYSSFDKTHIRQKLERLKENLEQKTPNILTDFTEKLTEGTEEELFNQLRSTKKENQIGLILVFLLMNNNYQNKKYFPLVLIGLEGMYTSLNKEIRSNMDRLEEKNKEITKEFDTVTKDLERLRQTEKDYLVLEKNYLELREEHNKTEGIKKHIEWKSNKNEPFLQHFSHLCKENNILIVTNERTHFLGTPLENFLFSYSEFVKDKKRKDLSRIDGKHLIITRVSLKSTSEWLNLTKYLENNEIKYTELSGYSLTAYIDEISTVLNRKEIYSYDYY